MKNNTIKKLIATAAAVAMTLGCLAGCGGAPASTTTPSGTTAAAPSATGTVSSMTGAISVYSREDGSGTRGAFVELFGVEQKDADGNKTDMTTDRADVTNSTSVMMTSIAGNPSGIGYISLGSLNETIKALEIDGVAASVPNIKAGTYKIARPFNIATKSTVNEATEAFMDYILSAEGQAVIEANGYISAVDGAKAFAGSTVAGKVVVSGSSSVTPVMEKLKEAYTVLNPNAEIDIQQSDSSTGMNNAKDGVCDIGMASRELKESELSAGLTPTVIAMDGIAVVVNNGNTFSGLTSEQVRAIFTGELTEWDAITNG